jgi:hypothetical protein
MSTDLGDETALETAHASADVHDPPVQIDEIEAGNIGTGERALVTVIAVVEMVLLTLNEGQSQTVIKILGQPLALKRYVHHSTALHYWI